jgi:hypothetical protein
MLDGEPEVGSSSRVRWREKRGTSSTPTVTKMLCWSVVNPFFRAVRSTSVGWSMSKETVYSPLSSVWTMMSSLSSMSGLSSAATVTKASASGWLRLASNTVPLSVTVPLSSSVASQPAYHRMRVLHSNKKKRRRMGLGFFGRLEGKILHGVRGSSQNATGIKLLQVSVSWGGT